MLRPERRGGRQESRRRSRDPLLCYEFQTGVQRERDRLFHGGISERAHPQPVHRLQPVREVGGAVKPQHEPSGRTISPPGIMQGSSSLPNGRYALRRSATLAKDQTYALYNLTQEQLATRL